jgi:RHS repeat-associated protein
VVTDNNGDLVQTLDYYPYGSQRINTRAGSFDEKRKFTGHEYDGEVGLTYMGARYYDGARGQFLSQDPAFINLKNLQVQLPDPQQWNSYSYARNNPLFFIDPNGEANWSPLFQSWKGYDVLCICKDNGLLLKAGEIFGGRDRALEAISRNQGNIEKASAESGVNQSTISAIIYEEQSHLFPPQEITLEKAFPNASTGGKGLMQVSDPTAIRTGTNPNLLQDEKTNIQAGANYLQSIQEQGANTTESLGASYNGSGAHADRYGQRIDSYVTNKTYQPTLVENLMSLVQGLTQLVNSLSGE